ncbi:pentapeptide repeat-containing protein [Streptomyces sp. NPDC087437]|uniref:pentapeptide repeat-containing protein n=1 Tax=Streptomyces sp. NPDC087437 TaxID=3365789 RepID=UPI00381EF0D3
MLDLMGDVLRETLRRTWRNGADFQALGNIVEFQQGQRAKQVLNNVRHARNLLAHTAGAIPLQPPSQHEQDWAKSRARELEQLCVGALQWTFEHRVGRRLPRLSVATLRLLLADFTAADLSDADFHGVDMTGMRWSEQGTCWPAAVDTDEIRKVSVEDPAGSGIYVIRFGASATFPILEYFGQ